MELHAPFKPYMESLIYLAWKEIGYFLPLDWYEVSEVMLKYISIIVRLSSILGIWKF